MNNFNINNQYNNIYFLWLLLKNDNLSVKKYLSKPFFALVLISNGFNIKVILPSIDEMVDDNDCLRQSWYPTTKLIIVHSKAVYLDKQNVI